MFRHQSSFAMEKLHFAAAAAVRRMDLWAGHRFGDFVLADTFWNSRNKF
jgi:hypothetical protein